MILVSFIFERLRPTTSGLQGTANLPTLTFIMIHFLATLEKALEDKVMRTKRMLFVKLIIITFSLIRFCVSYLRIFSRNESETAV